jgi:sugar phosphate permease
MVYCAIPMSDKSPGRVRWRIPFVLLVSVVIAYFDRLNISLALPKIAEEYGWATDEMGQGGLLMGIFFAGYGLANIFLSPLAERFGPRKSLFAAVIFFSIFTMAGALVGSMFTLFVVVRLLLGLGEGVHFPMNSKLTKNWFPVHERSRANGIWISGVLLATFLSPILLVPVIEHLGWRAMLLLLGLFGMLVTLPLLWRFCFNTPGEYPGISQEEIDYIQSGMEDEDPPREGFWSQVKPFLKNKIFWIVLVAGVCNNFASYGLLMWFPTYFTEGRGLEFDQLAYALPLQYGSGILGIALMSWLGDKTRRRGLLAGLGYLATALLAYLATQSAAIVTTVALFSAAIFFQMSFVAQEFAILQRILPKNRVGTGTGLYNGAAMFMGGGLGSWIMGESVAATGSYDTGILVLVGVALAAGITMLILSRLLRY